MKLKKKFNTVFKYSKLGLVYYIESGHGKEGLVHYTESGLGKEGLVYYTENGYDRGLSLLHRKWENS